MNAKFTSLSHEEQMWFENLLSITFKYRDLIWNQICTADFKREYYDNHLFLFLYHNSSEIRIPSLDSQVPINMLVQHGYKQCNEVGCIIYQKHPDMECILGEDKLYPTMFSLHIYDGFVRELEVYNVDGSNIDIERVLEGRKDFSLAPSLLLK